MPDTFADLMSSERARLDVEREAVFTQQAELEQRLAEIDREFAAIDAYEVAKSGKAAAGSSTTPSKAVRRGSRRDALLSMIRKYPYGLSRREILERLGFKGDPKNEMASSKALTALV